MSPPADDHLGVIVMGASAGGVDALSAAVAGLPAGLPAAVLVVMHLSPHGKSVLPHILETRGRLPAAHPRPEGEPLEAGRIYVAPPDRHLVVDKGVVRLSTDPTENGVRPSVDTLFRSAAEAYGPDVIGVVLSGMLDDGTAGLITIRNAGGVAVVQDPEEALFPGMPTSAVRFAAPHHVVSVEKLPSLLVTLVEQRHDGDHVRQPADVGPGDASMTVSEDSSAEAQPGEPSEFTCPECGGTLWEQREGGLLRYRCRVGHAFSSESLLAEQQGALESALWAAVVALQERADLAQRLSTRMRDRGHTASSARFDRECDDARKRAVLVRQAITHLNLSADEDQEAVTEESAVAEGVAEEVDPELEALLTYLREERGFDFSGYKRGTLGRRIAKRMQTVGAESYGAYQELLEAEPQEFSGLFNTILINVTSFVRDPEAWKFVSEGVIPQLVDGLEDEQVIRVWSAGCASGEEAYSLGVVLCDAVGEDAFRSRVKVYGTDVDDEALAVARQGRYPGRDVRAALTTEQVERYFEPVGENLVFTKSLRRSVIFGRHDLVQDPPISRVDLLVCRNTLMYFNVDSQQRILANFHFSLTDIGYLFVGKSEALVTRTNLFEPVDQKRHVYVKRQGVRPARAGMSPLAPGGRAPRPDDLIGVAFENAPMAQIVVDRTGVLVLANRHARTLFALGLNQVGRPFKDLELSYRPVELRSRIEHVLRERRPTTVNDVQLETPAGVAEFLDVHMQPLSVESQTTAVAVSFLEVGRYKLLQEELERSQRDLEAAYEELQSTNEELETTNEELQSTNEELETTNEELHSTNEELETMNEELKSTNEELESTNNELRERSYDLDRVNGFLESILGSLGSSVIVLNRQLAVRVWNRHSEDLWGLRADEVAGQPFLGLDIGLPVDRLSQAVRAIATGSDGESVDLRLPAVNRRGRAIEVDVRISGLSADGGEPDGVILLVNRVGDALSPAE